MNRRGFMTSVGLGAAASAGLLTADTRPQFHGEHQAGVFTPPQAHATFAAFDVTGTDLRGVFQSLTARAQALTAGGPSPELSADIPPADSGVLGPSVPVDGLTITVSVGASVFDRRFGVADRKPARLITMPTFGNDALEPAWSHGDLMLQICAESADTVHHALRDIARYLRGAIQLRYRMNGFISTPRPSGTPRNLMGFKDGTSNPTVQDGPGLIWVGPSPDEPQWTVGGTYQVVRFIRMLLEFWDRVSLKEQEGMFGRRRDSGAPLDGLAEHDPPNFSQDPGGVITPLDSHIRLANPRTTATNGSRLLRRAYNFDNGVVPGGNLDAGLIFCCYQQDIERQFATVQARLAEDPLNDYVRPFGGGYFFTLPGVTGPDDWYARPLLS